MAELSGSKFLSGEATSDVKGEAMAVLSGSTFDVCGESTSVSSCPEIGCNFGISDSMVPIRARRYLSSRY
jgi:hypothetical protein